MRLEINAFFMHKQDTDSFCRSFEKLTEQAEFVADSFEAVRSELCGISGGIGCLQNALDELDARIREENTVAGDLSKLNRQAEEFVDTVLDTDHAVAQLIHKEKDKFYQVNPWAIPPEPETDDRSWLEKAWDAGCEFVGDVIDGAQELFHEGLEFIGELGDKFFDFCREGLEWVKEAGHWVIETLQSGWENLKEFYEEHKRAIKEILIGTAIVVVLVVVTIATEGAAAPLLISALAYGGIGAVSGGLSAAAKGEDIFDGAAKGFMNGTISGTIKGAVDMAAPGMGEILSPAIAAGSAAIGETIHSLLDDGQISAEEGQQIAVSTVTAVATDFLFGSEGLDLSSFTGDYASELIGNLFGDLIGEPVVNTVFEGVMNDPLSVLVGPIGPVLPSILPALPPLPNVLTGPSIDTGINIDIDINIDITIDLRPFCFQMPSLSSVLC